MDKVLDNLPHKCIKGDGVSANFEGICNRNNMMWNWDDTMTDFREVDAPKGITKFEVGKQYVYTGTERGEDWASGGSMDFMLDGLPHTCLETSGFGDDAVFGDRHGWSWGDLKLFTEVPDNKEDVTKALRDSIQHWMEIVDTVTKHHVEGKKMDVLCASIWCGDKRLCGISCEDCAMCLSFSKEGNGHNVDCEQCPLTSCNKVNSPWKNVRNARGNLEILDACNCMLQHIMDVHKDITKEVKVKATPKVEREKISVGDYYRSDNAGIYLLTKASDTSSIFISTDNGCWWTNPVEVDDIYDISDEEFTNLKSCWSKFTKIKVKIEEVK